MMMLIHVPPDQEPERTANENIRGPMRAGAQSRYRDQRGERIGRDWDCYMIAVFIGKHSRHRKRTGSVARWEGVSSVPEASPTWIFTERPLTLRDRFKTQCKQ